MTAVRTTAPAGAVVGAELIKVWTLMPVRWLLGATVVAQVVMGAVLAAALDVEGCGAGSGCTLDPVRTSLGGVWLAQIATAALGVLAVSSEYDSAQVGVTLAATPRRLPVMLAKAGVVVSLVAPAALVGTLGGLLTGRLVLADNGAAASSGLPLPSLADPATLRAALGTVAYLALVAVLAVGVAALLRDAAAALVAVLGVLFLFPMLGMVVTDPTWQQRLHRYAPMDAGLAVQATRGLDDLAIAPWPGLALFGAYSAAALAAGTLLFLTRDA
jgi:hypothetical protein